MLGVDASDLRGIVEVGDEDPLGRALLTDFPDSLD
jgi:hypothetical protein